MENYLTAYPDQIHMVYCHNDDMCLGAVRAIAEAGLADSIKVLGVDGGAAEVYDAIRDGTMWGTVLNDASFIAVKIIQSARDLAEESPGDLLANFARRSDHRGKRGQLPRSVVIG